MEKYEGNVSENSVWLTDTPTPLALTLPFYITEAGHFYAEKEYSITRDEHDSFLLLFSVNGSGQVTTGETVISLPANHAVIIDCHKFHEYHSESDTWEFIWIHLKGQCASALFNILYPLEVCSVNVRDFKTFRQDISSLIYKVQKNDVMNSTEISFEIHNLFNTLIKDTIKSENSSKKKEHIADIDTVVEFIKNHYSEPISIEDMISNIHISKYHFIRLFRRIMGTTPYNYLTNYRINIAKTMLRSSNKSIAEIAEECGFLDTSNFITQFKKNTDQKPTQYRRDFTQ